MKIQTDGFEQRPLTEEEWKQVFSYFHREHTKGHDGAKKFKEYGGNVPDSEGIPGYSMGGAMMAMNITFSKVGYPFKVVRHFDKSLVLLCKKSGEQSLTSKTEVRLTKERLQEIVDKAVRTVEISVKTDMVAPVVTAILNKVLSGYSPEDVERALTKNGGD